MEVINMSKKITDLEIREFVENKGYKLLKIERKYQRKKFYQHL